MQERRREKKIKIGSTKSLSTGCFIKLKKKTHQTYYILVNIMAAEMRAMLDQLMGAERDVPLDERVNRKKLFTVNEYYY